MKNQLTLFVGILIAVILFIKMFVFTVNYDEVVIVTTWGEVGPDSVKDSAGIELRWPWPVQNVHRFSRRIQIEQDQLEQVQTIDNYSVVVRSYAAWTINDPLAFYVAHRNVDTGRMNLNNRLRETQNGLIGQYRFNELVNTDSAQLKLVDFEAKAREELQRAVDDSSYGIKIEQVGLRRLLLPEDVTEKVFDSMRATRERMAAETKETGRAEAAAITSEADSAREIILAFAERRAEAIRAEGAAEAAKSYGIFAANEPFAIFLRKIEALQKMLANNTTFVLEAETISPLDMFQSEENQR